MHSISIETEYVFNKSGTLDHPLSVGEYQILTALNDLHQLYQSNLNVSHSNKKDDMLSVAQASEYSGFSKSFIYKMTSTKNVVYYQPNGKTIFFKRSDLDDFLTRKKILSTNQIKEQAHQQLEHKQFKNKNLRK